jgi:transposase
MGRRSIEARVGFACNNLTLEEESMSLHCIDTTAAPREDGTILVVFELSKAKWKLGIMTPGSSKLSRYTVAGGEVAAVADLIGQARARALRCGFGAVRVRSLYEAGYDGWWLHRWLSAQGVSNEVIDPASVAVSRRARRAKTDRLDLEHLMRVLAARVRGEPRVCAVARPPTAEQEDARRRSRERERLVRERTAHSNRIKGLLFAQGIRSARPLAADFVARLADLRTGEGRALLPALIAELGREHARLRLVVEQIAALERECRAAARQAAPDSTAAKTARLAQLRGIGPVGGEVLVHEAFYRDFANRRQVGGYFGLTGTPYDSGQARREQGIGKAGNRRARAIAVELAWLWLRHQPDSALSRWFEDYVRGRDGRTRRVAIVALARKLMVALWRFLQTGLVPEGARVRAPARG